MKQCRTCKEFKSLNNFSPNKKTKDKLNYQCKSCINKDQARYRASDPQKEKNRNKQAYWGNPEKARHKARLCRFRTKYWPHLTIKEVEIEWNKMFTAQNGCCSICKKPKLLEVEHCHKTLKVRSLACNGCNTALARIHEDPVIALALIGYINVHNN